MTISRVNSAQNLSWVKNKRCAAKVENRSDLNSTFWILVTALGTIYPNPTHPFALGFMTSFRGMWCGTPVPPVRLAASARKRLAASTTPVHSTRPKFTLSHK